MSVKNSVTPNIITASFVGISLLYGKITNILYAYAIVIFLLMFDRL